jgi:hypothetical protein
MPRKVLRVTKVRFGEKESVGAGCILPRDEFGVGTHHSVFHRHVGTYRIDAFGPKRAAIGPFITGTSFADRRASTRSRTAPAFENDVTTEVQNELGKQAS